MCHTPRIRRAEQWSASVAQRPGGRYSYKIAHGSVVNGFQAPPPVGRKEGFTFLVYGDMGDPDHRKAKAPGCAAALVRGPESMF